jgi:hypothetical protein
MHLRTGQLVAFLPGSPPAAEGFVRGVVVRPDQPAAAHLRTAGERQQGNGLFAEAAEAVALAEEAGPDMRLVLVRVEPCRVAPVGFDFLMTSEWLHVIAETPAALN